MSAGMITWPWYVPGAMSMVWRVALPAGTAFTAAWTVVKSPLPSAATVLRVPDPAGPDPAGPDLAGPAWTGPAGARPAGAAWADRPPAAEPAAIATPELAASLIRVRRSMDPPGA
ncbi:hypothetical protein Ani05nite_25880 [Amorphoplanes nipponensis]|uniref:Uncharacterized protein n=1 Tax=Actinoplanes nipponensis TaxID=135950 RepID=A0A919MGX1_9ACTN|nr:hypothetical protein Ani05nite_25880 [Actinoplanes nipponensis]